MVTSIKGQFHIPTVMKQVRKDYAADVAQANTNQSTPLDKENLTEAESRNLKTMLASTFNFDTKFSPDFRDANGNTIAHVTADSFVSNAANIVEEDMNKMDINKDGYLSRYEQLNPYGSAVTLPMIGEYAGREVDLAAPSEIPAEEKKVFGRFHIQSEHIMASREISQAVENADFNEDGKISDAESAFLPNYLKDNFNLTTENDPLTGEAFVTNSNLIKDSEDMLKEELNSADKAINGRKDGILSFDEQQEYLSSNSIAADDALRLMGYAKED